MNKFNFSKINTIIPNMPEIKDYNLADTFYDRLIEYIVDFEADLKPDEEVGARLISFGESITIHIDDLGYSNPSLICFYGRDNNDRDVQLIQHITQISVLLVKVPRANQERERIGFRLKQKHSEENKD